MCALPRNHKHACKILTIYLGDKILTIYLGVPRVDVCIHLDTHCLKISTQNFRLGPVLCFQVQVCVAQNPQKCVQDKEDIRAMCNVSTYAKFLCAYATRCLGVCIYMA